MRNKVMTIVLVVSSVLILAGSLFAGYLIDYTEERGNTTKIDFDEKHNTETVEFRDMLLHPGETIEHTVSLTNEIEGKCKITIDFNEHKPEVYANELQNYVYVTIVMDGKELCRDVLLKDLFEKKFEPIECKLDSKKPLDIKISYHMPLDVGNEAAQTDAFFDLVIKSSNE